MEVIYTVLSLQGTTRAIIPHSRGGGDIYIEAESASAVVRGVEPQETEEEEEETTQPSLQVTPPKKGDRRCGAVEGKSIRAQKSPFDVTIQLQANMMLLCGRTLAKKMKKRPEDAESITCLTCYGVQVGLSYPVRLLKLSMDFTNNRIKYTELFYARTSLCHGAHIDLSLNYIFNALK